ncbi:unnamed protein product [Blepharisma stoltei]|uniref:Uncharacterized protein n=1 Tax=Blepharisma stoltei TaxID=1481888 RepID=A0AAU9KF57_9CILI|nr:unnamed protein product [Blepharisma stoltei]
MKELFLRSCSIIRYTDLGSEDRLAGEMNRASKLMQERYADLFTIQIRREVDRLSQDENKSTAHRATMGKCKLLSVVALKMGILENKMDERCGIS